MSVVGTLVVNFGEAAATDSGNIVAEWDDELNVDAAGEVLSRFVPGDEVWLLLHHDAGVTITGVAVTAGTVSRSGEVHRQRQAELGWGSIDDDQQLSYTPEGLLAYDWKGRVGSAPERTGRSVSVAGNFPCLAVVTFQVRFVSYRIQTPKMTLAEKETFPLRAYVYYTDAEAES